MNFRHNTQTETSAPKQTVPRSGSWLHTFKLSKSAEDIAGPELPEVVKVASKTEVRRQLLSAVRTVIFPAAKVKARTTFGGHGFLNF